MESNKRVITDANKVPLGRPPVTYGTGIKSSGSSLLKPSYLTGNSNSAPAPTASPTATSAAIELDIKKRHYEYEQYFNIIQSSSSTNFNTLPNMPGGAANPNPNSYANFNLAQQQQQQQLGVVKMSTDYSSWSEPGGFNTNANATNALMAVASQYDSFKRGNEDSNDGTADDERTERKRKRKSRWMGSENEKAVIPGMPTILPPDLPPDQAEAYVAQLQIEELTRKLRTGDLGIPPNPEDRSPSPEPIYGTDGKRLNTRDYRTRKKLEEERHKLIQRLLQLNPEYKAPADYRAPVIKIVDRVPIPQEENPEINFVGLLIGPRGNTLKGLEKDTGAKIIIRGKGSVKEGKVGGKAGHPLPGEDEPLHAYVTSNNPDSVKKACDKIKDIIRQGIEMPESQNDLRKNQLRELALLNGTLREGEGPKCTNCGATSHRTWNCPDKPNITSSVVCTVCGGAGHIAKDCRMKRPGAGGPPIVNANEKAKIDQEYLSLMAELGEAPPPGATTTNERPSHATSTGNLFTKSGPLKPLMGIPLGDVMPKRKEWGPPVQPQPPLPKEKPPPLMSQQLSWGYSQSSYQQQSQQPAQQSWAGQHWGVQPPPPPVPPPPASQSHQPPPPGMYWQNSGAYAMPPVNPPPPPPDYKPPPLPPNPPPPLPPN